MPMSPTERTVVLRLVDPFAAYKGSWILEPLESGLVRAMHTTYRTQDGTGCLIEQRFFPAHGSVKAFVNHLQLHGWSIVEAHQGAHHLL